VDDSHLGFMATLNDKSQMIGVLSSTNAMSTGSYQILAQTGATTQWAPSRATGFGLPGFGPEGAAFVATFAPDALNGIDKTNNVSLWAVTLSGSLHFVAQKGEKMQDMSDSYYSYSITGFTPPIVGGSGMPVAFLCNGNAMQPLGGRINPYAKPAICYTPSATEAIVFYGCLAGVGSGAPGGGVWQSLKTMVLPKNNPACGPIFTGALKLNPKQGITAANNFRLWAVNPSMLDSGWIANISTELFQKGQRIPGTNIVAQTFTALTPLSKTTGGVASGYDENGNVTVKATRAKKDGGGTVTVTVSAP